MISYYYYDFKNCFNSNKINFLKSFGMFEGIYKNQNLLEIFSLDINYLPYLIINIFHLLTNYCLFIYKNCFLNHGYILKIHFIYYYGIHYFDSNAYHNYNFN